MNSMSNNNINFSLSIKCDRCNEYIGLDEDIDADDCGYEAFTDFSWRVCEGCLTTTEHRDFQNNMGVTA